MKQGTSFVILAVLAALYLGGCSSGKSGGPAAIPVPSPTPGSPTPDSPAGGLRADHWFLQKMNGATLQCPEEGCPENIGMVGFYEDDFDVDTLIEQCTGWLYSENIVATNSHCIPAKVRENADLCSKSIAIKFGAAASGQPALVRVCKKLLNYSDFRYRQKRVSDKIDPSTWDADDYAFFEIEPAGRAPVKISRAGAADLMSVKVVKINPSDDFDELGGTFETLTCRTVQDSLLNLFYINTFSRTGLAVGCTAEGGNSGAPVFDEQGQVIGLLQSKKMEQYLQYLAEELSRNQNFRMFAQMPPHFVFSNLACIPDPRTGEYVKAACDDFADRALGEKLSEEVDWGTKRYEEIYGNWVGQLLQIFEFQREGPDSNAYGFGWNHISTKKCLRRFEDWPRDVQALLKVNKNNELFMEFNMNETIRIVREYGSDEWQRLLPQPRYSFTGDNESYRITMKNNGRMALEKRIAIPLGHEEPPGYEWMDENIDLCR